MVLRILILLLVASCSIPPGPSESLETMRGEEIWLINSDYVRTGILEYRGSQGKFRHKVHPDATFRFSPFQKGIWILNRAGADNIQYISETGNSELQWSVGPRSNLQDAFFLSPSEVWLSRYNERNVLRLNPQTGEPLGEIHFPPNGIDADGIPEFSYFTDAGETVWLQTQALDRGASYQPTDLSGFFVIDKKTHSVLGRYYLNFKNPLTDWKRKGNSLFVGGAGSPDGNRLDGGIEEWTISPPRWRRQIIDETDLNGNLVDFLILNDEKGVALVSRGTSLLADLVLFDLNGRILRRLTNEPLSGSGLVSAPHRNRFYVLDRDLKRPQVRSFDLSSLNEMTEENLRLSLPPLALGIRE